MSHRSGHIIINSLLSTSSLTSEQRSRLQDIEQRDEYTWSDRLYLAWLTFTVTDA